MSDPLPYICQGCNKPYSHDFVAGSACPDCGGVLVVAVRLVPAARVVLTADGAGAWLWQNAVVYLMSSEAINTLQELPGAHAAGAEAVPTTGWAQQLRLVRGARDDHGADAVAFLGRVRGEARRFPIDPVIAELETLAAGAE